MDCTTPPKVDKADTSSVNAPIAPALVAKSGSKVSDDAPIDGDSDLLNFVMAVPWIGCGMSFLQ
jgi:hypothetical protein